MFTTHYVHQPVHYQWLYTYLHCYYLPVNYYKILGLSLKQVLELIMFFYLLETNIIT